jgi:hypothetical protein
MPKTLAVVGGVRVTVALVVIVILAFLVYKKFLAGKKG